jgi:poly-gamma-glutamate system protein
LQKNVAQRMNFYLPDSFRQRISAFINIGGSLANLGTSEKVLKVKPGLNKNIADIPPLAERGVLFQMAARHIPIIHLLYIRGICTQYGLPWDPLPLPNPGESRIKLSEINNKLAFFSIAIIYFIVLASFVYLGRKQD